ncbi:hypothetical protein HPP92_017395 [Vanilla planifolia]|uniref:Uncharacterized protein n=1 Tax=Vanilla planifolia TaxID=51239 RepID=A0A835UNE0_VANPL|nr:hypothetical protein HPP92_017395 [Vanilla planifolia]
MGCQLALTAYLVWGVRVAMMSGFGMATSRLLGLPFSCHHDDLELIVKARFWRRPLAATLNQMESFGDHLQHCGGLRQAALVEDKLEGYDEGQQGQQPM